MKIKLLFVNDSLALAGGEKSLIALLSKVDANKYDIDLQLFRYGEDLDSFIPSHVNVLPPLSYTAFSKLSWKESLLTLKFNFIKSRLSYSYKLRKGSYRNSEKAQFFWESVRNAIQGSKEQYDVAIAYSQNTPTFYIVDKINAKKKLTWVNANMQFTKNNKKFQESYYSRFDAIVPVTEGTKEHMIKVFPNLAEKYKVIPDIVDYNSIVKMANLYQAPMNGRTYKILTVGRLDDGMKGMDITIETCKLIRDKGLDFHWYILGKGPFKESMQNFIKKHKLEGYLTLLGTTDNPYPYFKAADLYVQTSRHEGYGLTLVEARLLNLPVVTTRFDTVFGQMVHGKNGLVTDMNAVAVADAIGKIMVDKDLYNSILKYLKQEQKENLESVEKFDGLIQELLSLNPQN